MPASLNVRISEARGQESALLSQLDELKADLEKNQKRLKDLMDECPHEKMVNVGDYIYRIDRCVACGKEFCY